MSGNFVIWKYQPVDGGCALKDLKGLERTFRLNDGTPLSQEFPPDVAFHMDPDYPDDLLVTDNVLNADMVIVASARLRECVQAHAPAAVEYLPVTLVDHKGRAASKEHCIIHPIHPVDAIDKDRSVFETGLLDPDAIEAFQKLVLDESRIPSARALFRLQGFWDLTLVRRDLADALQREGFSGLRWLAVADYPES